jgi:hypothetical protein
VLERKFEADGIYSYRMMQDGVKYLGPFTTKRKVQAVVGAV